MRCCWDMWRDGVAVAAAKSRMKVCVGGGEGGGGGGGMQEVVVVVKMPACAPHAVVRGRRCRLSWRKACAGRGAALPLMQWLGSCF